MASFVPSTLQPGSSQDGRVAEVGPLSGSALADASHDDAADARRDPYVFTNLNPAPALQEQPGEVPRLTWIMTVVAGVVLGAVLTLIAAGA
jgi:hypothetical protein